MVRVLCYGAGAVGTLVGGCLARAGNPVALVGRPAHVDAVNGNGLLMLRPGAPPQRVPVRGYSSLAQALAAGFDPQLVLLTVKGFDTPAAITDLRALPPEAVVLTLQNGIGNEELLAQALGAGRTISGCITLSVGLPEPGAVQLHSARGGIGLAPLAADVAPVAALLREAGFTVQTYPDYRALKWSKLLLNMLGNAVCAVLDLPPEEVFRDRALCALERAAFLEALAVMRAQGIRPVDLPGFPVRLLSLLFRLLPPALLSRLLARRLGSGRGDKMPSLWIDLQKGRPRSEAAQLNGAVAARGKELGVRTPVNSRIMSALSEILADPARREHYRHYAPALISPHR